MRVPSLIGLLLASGGCQFHVTGLQLDPLSGGLGTDLSSSDLPIGGASDLATGGASDLALADLTSSAPPDLRSGFCEEASLVACYQFEDGTAATLASDGSPNHNDLQLANASESAGGHEGGALSVGAGSLVHIDHNASFDVAQLTIEMWINPSALPAAGARAGLEDEDNQYGFFIYAPGVLSCLLGGTTLSSKNDQIVVGQWQHVACTYDQKKARLYYNGAQVAQQPYTGALPTNQPNGLTIGSDSPSGDNFVGLIDEVRIFSVPRSAAQICTDYGGPGC